MLGKVTLMSKPVSRRRPYRTGNLGRNTLEGPGSARCDVRVASAFQLRERLRIRLGSDHRVGSGVDEQEAAHERAHGRHGKDPGVRAYQRIRALTSSADGARKFRQTRWRESVISGCRTKA